MDTDAWLADELAELDEAEQFIHDTMSAFVPSGQHLAGRLYKFCSKFLIYVILN